MDSFDAIVKVGGYIILFSVLLELFQALPGQIPLLGFLLPTLEVTNGILLIHSSGFPDLIEFPRDSRAYFVWRVLFDCTDTVHDSEIRASPCTLHHRKTGYRIGSQSSGSSLCFIFLKTRSESAPPVRNNPPHSLLESLTPHGWNEQYHNIPEENLSTRHILWHNCLMYGL